MNFRGSDRDVHFFLSVFSALDRGLNALKVEWFAHMKISGASLTTHTLTLWPWLTTVLLRARSLTVPGVQKACFYFWVFHSCTNLKQWTIWSHKTSTRPLYHMSAWCFLYHFGAFQLKLDRGVKGCEYKSSYEWQKVVSANVYDATCDFDHATEEEGCKRWRGILTEVASFGPRYFLDAHNDLTHSVKFTPSSRPPPSPPSPQLTLVLTKKERKNERKKWAGDWKVNRASTGLVLGSKRKEFYTDVLSDFKCTGWLFSRHGWHKPSKKKIHERQWGSCQAESSPTTRPWSTKRETFLFMWNYGRDTGNQLAASKSENLSWWRESKFVYK